MEQKTTKKDDLILGFIKKELSPEEASELIDMAKKGQIDEEDFNQLFYIWLSHRSKNPDAADYDHVKGFELFKSKISSEKPKDI